MNLFFKSRHLCALLITFIVITIVIPAYSLNLAAVYTSACKRELGIIVKVDEHHIHYLNLDGKVIKLRPHEVIFLAHYPIDQLPISNEIDFSSVPSLKVSTQDGTEIKHLVSGWPIGFTKDKISFLTPAGREIMINRQNMFSLDYFTLLKTKFKNTQDQNHFAFVHPHVFRDCPLPQVKLKKVTKVYPQQVLSDPIMIKREIDHLRQGYQQVERYYREQDFYPIPEVYPNATSLGIWQSFGSRYGSATHRSNNLTPVLTDAYSSDIFDYQHIFITGSAPLMFALHEEPQTQAYYAFKSSYFHFSAMIDPSLMLVGRNYKWSDEDFDKDDDKLVSTGMIEMGLDFGKITIDMYMGNSFHVGVFTQNKLSEETFSVPMIGMSFRSHNYKVQIMGGTGEHNEELPPNLPQEFIKMSGFRANLYLYYWKSINFTYSLILRNVEAQDPRFKYESQAMTHAGYASYKLFGRYNLGGFVSLENHNRSFGVSTPISDESSNYFKAGGFVSLSF
ncbi:MAG: hypothetical protein KDD58_07850 [Bdellovibrionales bacterium]|nr:hypothetical protein [Bdellovibrionales bacterium]